jgi:adenosine deaminase/CheY-like chemotaxis protein
MTTYAVYPKDSVHTRATARRLSAKPVRDGELADYLIFQQGEDEGLVDPRALEYFRTHAGQRARWVIFLPSYRALSSGIITAQEQVPDWFQILDPTDRKGYLSKIASLMECRCDGVSLGKERRYSLIQVKQLLLEAVGASNEDEFRAALGSYGAADHFREVEQETIRHLLASNECDDFYYLLALLSYGYADHSHDLNRLIPCMIASLAKDLNRAESVQVPIGTLETLGRQSVAKAVLVAAEALRFSMQAPMLLAIRSSFKVLVIDDDDLARSGLPSYSNLLYGIADAFFPESWQVFAWNPTAQDDEEFQRLCQYRSLDADPSWCSLTIGVRCMTSSGVAPHLKRLPLIELARDFDFILVDQLYKPPAKVVSSSGAFAERWGYRGEIRGPKLIQGLLRTLHDHASFPSEPGRLPQIIALSRDDDPGRIQEAIRSGARDYVLKDQLLRLPAVMSKVQLSIGEGADSNHRNFPELYKLPSETMGLLRTICIPGGRSLHRNSSGLQMKQDLVSVHQELSRLLRRIPKSDLHVHAGSCMSPEFLVVASMVGLVCGLSRIGRADSAQTTIEVFIVEVRKVASIFRTLAGFQSANCWSWKPSGSLPGHSPGSSIAPGEKWLSALAEIVKSDLVARLQNCGRELDSLEGWRTYQQLRAFMHVELAIRDRVSLEDAVRQVDKLTDFDAAFFGLRFSEDLSRSDKEILWSKDDLVRIYLLTLAAGEPYVTSLKVDTDVTDILDIFRDPGCEPTRANMENAWMRMRKSLFLIEGDEGVHSTESYRKVGWRLISEDPPFRLIMKSPSLGEDFAESMLSFESAPIEYSLATGLRSTNLVEYLEGCEFSGAEHLRHPFLIHIYAQQVVADMIFQGVLYAELRAAPDGYVNPVLGFEFPDVCQCLEAAFSHAQQEVLSAYRSSGTAVDGKGSWGAGVLGERYCWSAVSKLLNRSAGASCLPCKVSLIYVGKRHKSTREMILEAAAAAVMRPSGEFPIRTAREFIETEFSRCRVVGFDLAGKEVGNPPERFVEEFSRLSRLHIPLTVHAGENESAQFVEDSILRLRARRIGHGLSLVEDPGLMARVREDRVGVELCPISNFQTSHFGSLESRRPYPLRRLLSAGILVSINTDNPIISRTNMVREFFQASYAWGDSGMPLWEALRLVRMGFVMSFLNLPERRALLDIVGQFLFDLFCEESTVQILRDLSQAGAE